MKTKTCPTCGQPMKRNGRTSAGTQRWRCGACGASTTHGNDVTARDLEAFLRWLFSRDVQADMPGGGRTFRRRTARFWEIWPMPEETGEVHRVVYVDGIYLARDVVVLVARSDDFVLAWYLARSENSRAWGALLSRIAPPEVVVTDGGTGFERARREHWPGTRVQRCTFHAFCQVRRYTTSRPRLQAGVELYGLARDLLGVETLSQADLWVERYLEWSAFWADFLEERSVVEGRWCFTHERLRKARSSLGGLVSSGTLFTYLDPVLTAAGPLPATNNAIEGGVNAQLRAVLRSHRGLSLVRRIKAVYWWCYMHTECPKPAAEILRSMPTDADIDLLYRTYATGPVGTDGPAEWGDGLVWEELHHGTRYPYAID